MLPDWDELKRGTGCPLCAPRPDYNEHVYLVRRLRLSTLYLLKNQAYPGSCGMVVDCRHVTNISDLSSHEWSQVSQDLRDAEGAILRTFAPAHINIECLGNTVPHLHWGLIARYRDDGRWGHPIWTTQRSEMPNVKLSESQYAALCRRLLEALGTS